MCKVCAELREQSEMRSRASALNIQQRNDGVTGERVTAAEAMIGVL